ncbi:unnamed protein product [Rhodiola kirilowii]
MARTPSKHERDQALGFEGFLNGLQDWDLGLKENDKKMRPQADEGTSVSSSQKMAGVGTNRKVAGTVPKVDHVINRPGQYSYLKNYDAFSSLPSSMSIDDDTPTAASEKEQGNEYFKQKKYKEAIDCYSRSIGLSPTAVAYANRAMAYLKIRRFQEAEDDCTEALNLDDRYIKAYSRRSTARKELKRFKESMEDADFALKLEPNNQEVKKQYSEAKSMYEKDLLERTAGALHRTTQGAEKNKQTAVRLQELSSPPVNSRKATLDSAQKEDLIKRNRKSGMLEQKPSVQELAARAASQAINEAAQNITSPTSAYQFEATWRGFSGDHALQARLLKATSPSALPQLFKNALTSTMLVEIIKCLATIFNEEMELTVQYLENLTKVSRFDMVVLCLSNADRTEMANVWNNVFSGNATTMEYAERLDNLRPRYCRGG